jgi:hypothetical protein
LILVTRSRLYAEFGFALVLFLGTILTACLQPVTPSVPSEPTPLSPTPDTPSTPSSPWTDASRVFDGVCFEAAQAINSQVFVLRSAQDHIQFYDRVDQSGLCRHPITRNPFEFGNGQILAGLWSAGYGCKAHHELIAYQQDDANRRLIIVLRFVTEGTCDYQLLRAYWIGIDGLPGYDVQIVVG